jgi:hypothetical protein
VIKAKIDRPQLEKSLKKFAKLFGETSAQAVVRWSVQTCRELAMETQAWGKVQTKKKQEGAILADAYNVLLVVDTLKSTGKGYRVTNQGKSYSVAASKVLKSPGEISDPLVSRFGVHLVQVLERREAPLSMRDKQDMARNILRERKFDETMKNWEREMRGRAYVEYRDPPQ